MSVSADFVTYVVDQLAGFPRVLPRRMFGGVGLYANELFFGLIAHDVLYLKVDDSNRTEYVARNCQPFRPRAQTPDVYSMNYFAVPAEIIEDPEELCRWAHKALLVAAAASSRSMPADKSKAKRRQRSRRAE
jgi:DNA transformation protein and related proteins